MLLFALFRTISNKRELLKEGHLKHFSIKYQIPGAVKSGHFIQAGRQAGSIKGAFEREDEERSRVACECLLSDGASRRNSF